MEFINKRGLDQLVIVVSAILLLILVGFLIFKWTTGTLLEETQKSADRANAENICRSEVQIRINNIVDNGDNFAVNVENLKSRELNDFLIRFEAGNDIEIKKIGQRLGAYENTNVNVEKPVFTPERVKLIPQIVLNKDEIQSFDKGWWLCSGKIAVYDF